VLWIRYVTMGCRRAATPATAPAFTWSAWAVPVFFLYIYESRLLDGGILEYYADHVA
jgi:hypothetical protein